jgi:hypothetical protein
METKNIFSVGFYSALLTSILTIVTFGIAFMTPPLSGPWCTEGCFSYPFTDIISRFPRDYYWMYPAIILSLVYYVLMVSIHYFAPVEKKIFSHIGLSFALVSAATLIINYFLQVSVVQPSLLLGETEGISLISQFNAHGIFIVLEEIGFSMMSLSLLFMALVLIGKTKVEKAIRWIFISNFVLNALSLTLISIFYGIQREYRFEIATISFNWLALISSGILLSIVFRRAIAAASPHKITSREKVSASA